MESKKLKLFFHYLADQGTAIRVYRLEHPDVAHLPAQRIEFLITLQKIKFLFYNNSI